MGGAMEDKISIDEKLPGNMRFIVHTRPPKKPTQITSYARPSAILRFGHGYGDINSWELPLEAI